MIVKTTVISSRGIIWESFPAIHGWDKHGTFYVASELKALEGICAKIELFLLVIIGNVEIKGRPDGTKETADFEKVKSNPTNIEDLQ